VDVVVLCLTAISIDDVAVQIAFAGDNTVITLTGIDSTNLSIGKTDVAPSILSRDFVSLLCRATELQYAE